MTWLRACPLIVILGAVYVLLSARVAVSTPGRFGTAPQDWWVLVRMEPQKEDRWLDVIADGDQMYQQRGFTLTGDGSPRLRQVWFKGLASGCYAFVAQVRTVGPDGPIVARAEAPWPLSVSGPGTSGDVCGSPAP